MEKLQDIRELLAGGNEHIVTIEMWKAPPKWWQKIADLFYHAFIVIQTI